MFGINGIKQRIEAIERRVDKYYKILYMDSFCSFSREIPIKENFEARLAKIELFIKQQGYVLEESQPIPSALKWVKKNILKANEKENKIEEKKQNIDRITRKIMAQEGLH